MEQIDTPLASLSADGAFDATAVQEAALRSRTSAGQRIEVQLAVRIFDTMTLLGMKGRYRVG